MAEEAQDPGALTSENGRLRWRIATLEAAEAECARAVSALAESEARFRAVVEASPDGIAVVDMDRRITYLSPQAARLLGAPSQDALLGRDFFDHLDRAQWERMSERIRGLVAGDRVGPTEWTAIRADGTPFPMELNGEVLRAGDGSPSAVFAILRDISGRKRLERAMRWAEKLESLGLMAAGIAHELNNDFQVARGNLEMAAEMAGPVPGLRDVLRRVEGGVDRATDLARKMLDYSGRALTPPAPLDLNAVAEDGLAIWREFLGSDSCLVFLPGKALPAVIGDDRQVMKVLSALALNALEAIEGRAGLVTISTALVDLGPPELGLGFWPATGHPGRFLRLEVKDTGPGMAPEVLERCCDPFFTTKGPGRGLGLSVSLGILGMHAALFQVVSGPGQGTAARAYFPIPALIPAPPPPPAQPARAANGILVAEDDEGIREILVRLLRRWGFDPVLEARDGKDALDLFLSHRDRIQVLLTDATMPRMSGPELFEAIRRIRPDLPGVLITGYSGVLGRELMEGYRFSAFLLKPFPSRELKEKLDAVLGR